MHTSLNAEKTLLINQIAYLSGTTPSAQKEITITKLPPILPLPNAGLPSEVLKNRPDIKAAWLRLESADWATKSAWADRLPSINLSGTGTQASNSPTDAQGNYNFGLYFDDGISNSTLSLNINY